MNAARGFLLRALLFAAAGLLGLAALTTIAAGPSVAAATRHAAALEPGSAPIADSTWVDHDARPVRRPPDWEPGFFSRQFREVVAEPIAHMLDIPDKLLFLAKAFGANRLREAADVNALDEVPNSTWFTNRNHVHAVPAAEMENGPDSTTVPSKPWTIIHPKHGGASAGFTVRDADGRKWLIKLDVKGHPQLSSGADMVARTLLHAAGYAVPHNEPVRFARSDLAIDAKLQKGQGREHLTGADLDATLERGARLPDSSYIAIASLYLPGHALGSGTLEGRRPGDPNDWYAHPNRRELRGLYVIASWLNFWDTKDANFLDAFETGADSLGHVEHYLLDPGSSFGADADGEKRLQDGYESVFDLSWIGRRLVTLGFVVEPWRRSRQETGIPSIGRFSSDTFDPGDFTPGEPDPDFREMTDGDAYWGAKIVASFSDAQIAAAVDAAHYDDPRASAYLVRNLIERRDAIERYWFARVAPLDFFEVRDDALRFEDLAVDLGKTRARSYRVQFEPAPGGGSLRPMRVDSPEISLAALGAAAPVTLEIAIEGSRAKPVRVELDRAGTLWTVRRVRHGSVYEWPGPGEPARAETASRSSDGRRLPAAGLAPTRR